MSLFENRTFLLGVFALSTIAFAAAVNVRDGGTLRGQAAPFADTLPALADETIPADEITALSEDPVAPSGADNTYEEDLLRPAVEEQVTPVTTRIFYRRGEPVDITNPSPDPDTTEQPDPILPAEEPDATGAITNALPTEAVDPSAPVEALQEAEAATEEVAQKPAATPEPSPGFLSGIGGIGIVGIAAVLGALSLGAFAFLKKKLGARTTVPKQQSETVVPPPPNETGPTRLQEAIEEIKEEVDQGGTSSTDAEPQQ